MAKINAINNRLLKSIKKKLYEVNSLASSPTIKTSFLKNDINVDILIKNIEYYLTHFYALEVINDDSLLELLEEKLSFLISHKNYIRSNKVNIEESIHFIEKYKNIFFKYTTINTSSKPSSLPIKKTISFLTQIDIKEFFSIDEIILHSLKDKKEIYIVGENGDGKTLLLQAIAVGVKGTFEDGLKEFRAKENEYDVIIENKEDIENNFFAYGASRNNFCQIKSDTTGYLSLFSGEYDLKSPIEWLIELYNAQNAKEEIVISLDDAIELLRYLLNKDVDIEVNYKNVIFKEKNSKVTFNQLSAGYKGIITIICDLIARLSEKQQVEDIAKFQGVVLIDEVELHLHPKWKYNFMKKLRDTFPLIQFIVTTHSPTVILGASKEAVFYKIYKDNGKVAISNQIPNEGYTSNSLVSSPLFDMETITSRDYNKAISSDDYIYEKIHKVVAKKIEENINVDEEALLKLIDEELDKI